MSNLCIIPARGGSKRIPRKNIRDFLGKPIIAYSIEAALNSGLFEVVMVSTDDEEIAEISREYGAMVPFLRSSENANDFATTADVILEVLNEFSNMGLSYNHVCCCYSTAPFVSSKRLKEGLEMLQNDYVYSVFPVVEFGYPILRSLQMSDIGQVALKWPEHLICRKPTMMQVNGIGLKRLDSLSPVRS
jgi:N-acylneuraminate cytidylyltransferase